MAKWPAYGRCKTRLSRDIAKVNANGTEGPPPPPPPPQDEMSNKQTRNFIDFILLLYKKRGSKPSFLLKFLKKC